MRRNGGKTRQTAILTKRHRKERAEQRRSRVEKVKIEKRRAMTVNWYTAVYSEHQWKSSLQRWCTEDTKREEKEADWNRAKCGMFAHTQAVNNRLEPRRTYHSRSYVWWAPVARSAIHYAHHTYDIGQWQTDWLHWLNTWIYRGWASKLCDMRFVTLSLKTETPKEEHSVVRGVRTREKRNQLNERHGYTHASIQCAGDLKEEKQTEADRRRRTKGKAKRVGHLPADEKGKEKREGAYIAMTSNREKNNYYRRRKGKQSEMGNVCLSNRHGFGAAG